MSFPFKRPREQIFFSPTDVAARLGLAPKTIYNWLNTGKIRGIKMNGSKHGRTRIPKEEVERVSAGLPPRSTKDVDKEKSERELRRTNMSPDWEEGDVLEENEPPYYWRG